MTNPNTSQTTATKYMIKVYDTVTSLAAAQCRRLVELAGSGGKISGT